MVSCWSMENFRFESASLSCHRINWLNVIWNGSLFIKALTWNGRNWGVGGNNWITSLEVIGDWEDGIMTKLSLKDVWLKEMDWWKKFEGSEFEILNGVFCELSGCIVGVIWVDIGTGGVLEDKEVVFRWMTKKGDIVVDVTRTVDELEIRNL